MYVWVYVCMYIHIYICMYTCTYMECSVGKATSDLHTCILSQPRTDGHRICGAPQGWRLVVPDLRAAAKELACMNPYH